MNIDTGALILFWCINLVLMQRWILILVIFLILVHELVPIDTGAQARLIVNRVTATSLAKVLSRYLSPLHIPTSKPQVLWVTQ